MLLVKEKNFDLAISKYIEKGKFQEAEQFCAAHTEAGLLTELLEKYFEKYKHYRDRDEMEAAKYRERAIRLMQ